MTLNRLIQLANSQNKELAQFNVSISDIRTAKRDRLMRFALFAVAGGILAMYLFFTFFVGMGQFWLVNVGFILCGVVSIVAGILVPRYHHHGGPTHLLLRGLTMIEEISEEEIGGWGLIAKNVTEQVEKSLLARGGDIADTQAEEALQPFLEEKDKESIPLRGKFLEDLSALHSRLPALPRTPGHYIVKKEKETPLAQAK